MLNVVILNGRIANDVELKTTPNGNLLVNISVATRRDEKITDFHKCNAWGTTAEFISKWFAKGDGVNIVGELRNSSYDKNGTTVNTEEILIKQVSFVDGKKGAVVPAKAEAVPEKEVLTQQEAKFEKVESLDELPF